ncbi:MAG: MBL fold metallo-hydrolase [Candidatus Rokubacteria bacterium]|nr:MBL fold metallo-hydrolase [Candidatus Rokubacteria bacterium]
MRRTALMLAIVLACALIADQAVLRAQPKGRETPIHHLENGFRNLDAAYAYPMMLRARKLLRRTFEGWPERGAPLTVLENDGAAIRANGVKPTVTWVGHSTFLIQLGGLNILTDPNWNDRASPVRFAGPRRLVPPGLAFAHLPPIHAVVISHDHYDHLDLDTVRRLVTAHAPRFFVPLGLKPLLADVGANDVVELDWWSHARLGPVTFTATPAQHSSGRGLHDQYRRLWASWVFGTDAKKVYFAGDTGYFAGFKEIGSRLGPLTLALMPIGGYSGWADHHPNHLNPEEAVRAFEDLRAQVMVPMHWGTFELNKEPNHEPPARMFAEAVRRGIEERMAPLSPGQEIGW